MRIAEVLQGTLRHPMSHRFGFCPICGHRTVFLCLDPVTARNNMYCIRCVSASRNRHLALRMLQDMDNPPRSLRSLARGTELKILNANRGDAISKAMGANENYHSFILDPDVPLGHSFAPRETCQNLEELEFEDAAFDILITEDVFEHVYRPAKAFQEVYRILKPGGSHYFTIPFNFTGQTVTRVEMDGTEEVHHLPAHYHGDKIRGQVLVISDFGRDLMDDLSSIGFQTDVAFSRYTDRRYGIVDSFVFRSIKLV